jgi:hypothetical protein
VRLVVRRTDTGYLCLFCHQEFTAPDGNMMVEFRSDSGETPMRVLTVGDREVHRCQTN